MYSLKVKVSFPYYILEARGLVQLSRFSEEDLSFSSWWSRLSEKLVVSGIIGLVAGMGTYLKSAMRPKTLGIPTIYLYFSRINLLHLSPEIGRLTYSGIRQENCEVTL